VRLRQVHAYKLLHQNEVGWMDGCGRGCIMFSLWKTGCELDLKIAIGTCVGTGYLNLSCEGESGGLLLRVLSRLK
jgi:hypothetical protein